MNDTLQQAAIQEELNQEDIVTMINQDDATNELLSLYSSL